MSARWRIELYDPKTKHVYVVRLDASTAEIAARMAQTHLILRVRSGSLRGRKIDYRVEQVALVRGRPGADAPTNERT